MTETTDLPPPTLWRRLGAIIYDSLLLLAVLFAAGLVVMIIVTLLPGQEGVNPKVNLKSNVQLLGPYRYLYSAYLLAVAYLFFGWFWTHGGQTLGMRAWRLRIVRSDGSTISWLQSGLRLLIGVPTLGIGLLWILFNSERLSLYDLLLHTKMQLTPKHSSR